MTSNHSVTAAPHPLFMQHRQRLLDVVGALEERSFRMFYAEHPGAWPEHSHQQAQADFTALLQQPFVLEGPDTGVWSGAEASPWGLELGIRYPQWSAETLLQRQQAALPQWRDAGVETRTGIALEMIERLHQISPLMALAVQHTSGQSWNMAFQAGGPHAQERALEAVASAWKLMNDIPLSQRWQKPMGKRGQLTLDKRWFVVPRGIALAIGCSTFPTWNTYPGLFASLVCGNPVLVKPHPDAILPLALTVRVLQQVLVEQGFDPLLVSLLVDTREQPVAAQLASDPRIRLIDFTGNAAFGNQLEQQARQAEVFTEKAGLNSILLHSIGDIDRVAANLAFSLTLYSGQMCTTPQAIYIPDDGIEVNGESWSFDRIAARLASAISDLTADQRRASAFAGCIQSDATLARLNTCRQLAHEQGVEILLDSQPLHYPDFPQARSASPLLLATSADRADLYGHEWFGPITWLVRCRNFADARQHCRQQLLSEGAMTLGLYSTDNAVIDDIEELAQETAVSLSINLDDGFYINQSASFSDLHGSGGNPAANTAFTDAGFVARRFVVVQSRRSHQPD